MHVIDMTEDEEYFYGLRPTKQEVIDSNVKASIECENKSCPYQDRRMALQRFEEEKDQRIKDMQACA